MALKIKRKKLSYSLLALLALVIVIFVLEITNTTHLFHKTATVSAPGKPITHLPSKPAPDKNPSTATNAVTPGTATDKNGQSVSGISTDPTQWATSTSGKVTLKAPLNNATFKSGDTITGSADASQGQLQYRLVDNQAGVIAQGPLNVVNGNFTATLTFTPYASSGRLDIFNVDANAREINEVQVTLNF